MAADFSISTIKLLDAPWSASTQTTNKTEQQHAALSIEYQQVRKGET